MIKKALRQLRNNLGAFILALLLAFVIWITASLQIDPFEDRRYPNVLLTPVHQPDNTVFFVPISEQVTVTARARDSVLAELKTSSFRATVDLSGVQPGVSTTVAISVTCTNDQVRVESVEPAQQVVHLEMVHAISRTVTVRLYGAAATGYEAGSPVTVPEQVQIRGPEPYLESVVTVVATVDIEGAKKNITDTASIELLDAQGHAVPGLELKPKVVEVHVPVRSLAEYKPDVKVVPVVRGDPAPGYRKGDILVQPPSVTLEGLASVLDKLPDFVETLPLTITGATETVSRRSLLAVPTDVSVVEVSYVTVTVEILPILGTRTMSATVELLRVLPGMRAIPTPNMVTVTLEGPDAELAALKAEDLLIVLDLRGYSAGMYQIKPDVLVPEGLNILSVDPETIGVVIEPMPTPVPTVSPTPTRKP